MRSIRLSLILYFLLLLGAALGGVSYFCYESTQEALAAKESSTRKLREKQFEETKLEEAKRFDASVLARMRTLQLNAKLTWYHHRLEPLQILGMLGASPLNGPVLIPWAEATWPPLAGRINLMLTPDLRIQRPHSEDEPPEVVVHAGEFFQTYFPTKDQVIPLEASETLGGLVWTLNREARSRADDNQMYFDEVPLKDGKSVRRVTMKTTVNWSRRGIIVDWAVLKDGYSGKKLGPGPSPPPLPGPDEGRPTRGFKPPIYLQFGIDTADRDSAIANLRANLTRDLESLREELDLARSQLRTRLLWIGLGAFAALLVGGFFLVRHSLSPLNRLSDAVSQVSEKDFRLPIDETKLPSELQPIAGRLTETLEQLKRAFGREKQAAADISHELRTPVAALLTRLEISLRKQRSAEEYREVLQDCRESGQQIHQLVERLLALARLDAGADLLRPRDVDANSLADQCAALVRPLAEARGLRLTVHHNGPAMLHADPDKLREVLTNLLHNAIEYNKPDGTIDVKVARNNGHLDMEVRDSGIGITAEARRHIFERFFRADPSRQADTPHAGLGLAIVKGYVDLMGGAIDVDSTIGAGSTFRVRLPVA
jgi:heavy metal sensor kinase